MALGDMSWLHEGHSSTMFVVSGIILILTSLLNLRISAGSSWAPKVLGLMTLLLLVSLLSILKSGYTYELWSDTSKIIRTVLQVAAFALLQTPTARAWFKQKHNELS